MKLYKKIVFTVICFLILVITIVLYPDKKSAEECSTEYEESLLDVAIMNAPTNIVVNHYNSGYLHIMTDHDPRLWLYKFSSGKNTRPYLNGAGANNYEQAYANKWTYLKKEGWSNTDNPYIVNQHYTYKYKENDANNYKMISLEKGEANKKSFYCYSCPGADECSGFNYNNLSNGNSRVKFTSSTSANDASICNLTYSQFENCSIPYSENSFFTWTEQDLANKSFTNTSLTVKSIPANTGLCETNLSNKESLNVIFTPTNYVFTLKPIGFEEKTFTFTWDKEEGKTLTGVELAYFNNSDYGIYKSLPENQGEGNIVPNDFIQYSLKEENTNVIDWNPKGVIPTNQISYNSSTGQYSLTATVSVAKEYIKDAPSYTNPEDGENYYFIPLKLVKKYSGNQCSNYLNQNKQTEFEKAGCCNSTCLTAPSGWCCQNTEHFNNNKLTCCTKEENNRKNNLELWKFYPKVLADNYNNNCLNVADSCSNLKSFKEMKIKCCNIAREEINKGKSYSQLDLPDNKETNYKKYCESDEEEPKPDCRDDSVFNKNTLSCCENSKNILTDQQKKRCPSNESLSCNNDTSTISSTKTYGDDTYKIDVTEKIEFYEYKTNNNIKVKSGAGFEYNVKVKHTIEFGSPTFTREYDSEDKLNTAVANINSKVEMIKNDIQEKLENNIKYTFYNAKENYEKYDNFIVEDMSGNNVVTTENDYTIEYKHCWDYDERGYPSSCGKIEKDITISSLNNINMTYTLKLPATFISKVDGEIKKESDVSTSKLNEYETGGNKFYTDLSNKTGFYSFYIYHKSTLTDLEFKNPEIDKTNSFFCEYTSYSCESDGSCPPTEGNPNCQTDSNYFDNNKDYCCKLEYYDGQNGNYIPSSHNYDNECPTVTESEIENKPYSFRTISLTNPFPNRNAGFNWGYDNETLKKDYIWKGQTSSSADSIYSETPMYEITLTSDLITKIKQYNTNSTNNYLKWDMNYSDGQATSKFLTNTLNGKIKFWGNTDTNILGVKTNRKKRYGLAKITTP